MEQRERLAHYRSSCEWETEIQVIYIGNPYLIKSSHAISKK